MGVMTRVRANRVAYQLSCSTKQIRGKYDSVVLKPLNQLANMTKFSRRDACLKTLSEV